MNVRDCIQIGSSFSLDGSSSMLAMLATILISATHTTYQTWLLEGHKGASNILHKIIIIFKYKKKTDHKMLIFQHWQI